MRGMLSGMAFNFELYLSVNVALRTARQNEQRIRLLPSKSRRGFGESPRRSNPAFDDQKAFVGQRSPLDRSNYRHGRKRCSRRLQCVVAQKEPDAFAGYGGARPNFDRRSPAGPAARWRLQESRQRSDERRRLVVMRELHDVKFCRTWLWRHTVSALISKNLGESDAGVLVVARLVKVVRVRAVQRRRQRDARRAVLDCPGLGARYER